MIASPDPIRRSLATRDPLAGLLFERWRLTPLHAALLGLSVDLLFKALLVWHDLHSKDPPRCWAFINWGDWDLFAANVLVGLLIVPSVWAFYAWMTIAPPALLEELDRERLFSGTAQDVATTVVARNTRLLKSRLWPFLALLVPLSLGTFWITQFHRQLGASLYLQLVPWSFGWFMAGMIVLRELGLIRILRQYFATPGLELRPLHPDRCGGLGPLNRYAMHFTYLIAMAACGLALLSYMSIDQQRFHLEYSLHLGILLYLVLAPYCFFAALGTAHRAMQDAKDKQLQAVADQFLVDYQAAQQAISKDFRVLSGAIDKLKLLNTLYRTTLRFPVWPFDWSHIRWFFTAVLTPVGGLVLSQIPILVGLLHQLTNKAPALTAGAARETCGPVQVSVGVITKPAYQGEHTLAIDVRVYASIRATEVWPTHLSPGLKRRPLSEGSERRPLRSRRV